ncbi:dna2 [Candida oxycetoniae]|uniref:DNA replication ATP-dependent helicase/nuclease DNA2 n=1 Tax=Candida oxycetoniae TaxID=497107 RepID=A0AAI9X048_9ASCO|nr:dna2 [Candida oxycetoniae]KAI3407091.2 dna2 [Candida oxycetoniae]
MSSVRANEDKQRGSSGGTDDAKCRVETESILPLKRPKKRSYFFTPVNNITAASKPLPLSSSINAVVKPINPNTLHTHTPQPVKEIKAARMGNSPKRPNNGKEELKVVTGNSDDSFDGILWRESPVAKVGACGTHVKNKNRLGDFSSSPMKTSNKVKSGAPQTPEVLLKYGINFHDGSSRSPRLTKTISDLSSKESAFKKSTSTPPSLYRTTSAHTAHTKACESLEGTLSCWMQKLDGGSADADADDGDVDVDENEKEKKQDSPRRSDHMKSSPLKKVTACITTSDPFSDDDEEVLDLLSNHYTSEKGKQKQITAVNSALHSSPLKKKDEDLSDDPFSDQDVEDLVVTLNERSKDYSKYSKSFQAGMKKSENNSVLDGKYHQQYEEFSELVYGRPELRRYKIVSLTEQTYGHEERTQYIVHVECAEGTKTVLIVRGEYCELEFRENDVIHLIITDEQNPRLVDDTHNLLIWNPDVLLSATTIAQQINCPRKSVILSRYKFPGSSSIPIIVGEIVHFIFQECMATETWTIEFMNEAFDKLIGQYLISLFSLDSDARHLKEEVSKHFSYLETWFNKYYKKTHNPSTWIDNTSERDRVKFTAEEVLDIEEEIKSPVYGMKGKIDATIIANLMNPKVKGRYLLPMEIKTGREYTSHSAQATLYALLFKDRYNLEINSSILVYTKEEITKRCNINAPDLRALVNLRNKVSQHFLSGQTLPPLMKRSVCERCEIQAACMAINYMVEDGKRDEAGIDEDVYDNLTSSISNAEHKEFFKLWDRLIAREEEFSSKAVKRLWTIPSNLRQSSGRCLDNLKIVESTDDTDSIFYYSTVRGDKSQARRFTYVFEKDDNKETFDFLSSKLNENDRVIISDENGHFAITTGIVKSICSNRVEISTRRRIITHDHKLANFNEKNNQVLESLIRGDTRKPQISNKRFILDKDEMFYGLGLARYNILSLFLEGTSPWLRQLVVDLKAPTFTKKKETPTPTPMPKTMAIKHIIETLNPSQQEAFEKVLSANDYSLVLGMPGTGKSTLIVELIRYIIRQEKTVLLTSYTNSAVDNILLKLIASGEGADCNDLKFIRIGHPSRVHKALHKYIPDYGEPIQTHSQFENIYGTPNIVAATCLGIRDACFNIRLEFDYCIVDEASQITLPICLGPIHFAKKFVLVGDHFQLPPLVLHPDPEVKQGLSQSLFKRLAEAHPTAVSELSHQYRMCEDIMQLSNILVYENKLKCGNSHIAKQHLRVPNPRAVSRYAKEGILSEEEQWMDKILDENSNVLFLDHDRLEARESVRGEAIQNYTEAELIRQIVKALLLCGVDEKEIGVMSFYRAQLELLKRKLSSRMDLEILTADQYQGREKECVIISLVRSNDANNAGELLKEWRRLNVAVTRAKSKLIILGSRSTLSETDTTRTFIDFLDSKGWYYLLPVGADNIYNLPQTANSSPKKDVKKPSNFMRNNPVVRNIIESLTN